MRVILTQAVVLVALSVASPAVNAQGTTSTNRPAGSDFSVTTGIGSSATVTTHKVEPGPPHGGSSIDGLDQSLPDDDQGKPDNSKPDNSKPDNSKLDHDKPADTGARSVPSSSTGPNAIARDRVESPQDK